MISLRALAVWIALLAVWLIVTRRLGLTRLGFVVGFGILSGIELAILEAFLRQ